MQGGVPAPVLGLVGQQPGGRVPAVRRDLVPIGTGSPVVTDPPGRGGVCRLVAIA